MSKFLRHEECPKCGSKNNLAVYDDGGRHCFGFDCGYHVRGDRADSDAEVSIMALDSPQGGRLASIKDRRLSEATCRKFGVTVEYSPEGSISKHFYPYHDLLTGDLKFVKTRFTKDKKFLSQGDPSGVGLFGQKTCRGSGKYITITEGELDAMSVSEMFDNKWDVVSLRSGATGARRDIQEQLEFLEGYENVVLCFDADAAGKAAVDAVKDLFSPNKLKIITLTDGLKDASDALQQGKLTTFTQAWWNAKAYRPDGIVAGSEMWERLIKSNNVKSVPYPWAGLNTLTKGFRVGELVTLTSGSGMGKSSVVRELEHYCLNATEGNIGVLALEESVERSIKGIMSVEAGYPMHLDETLTPEDMMPFFEKVMGSERFYFFDHFGSTSEDNILARVRYMAKALECKTIFLDHLSIIVSAQETQDERKAIDAIMTKLRTLVQELNVCLFLVSHLRRAHGKAHEDGAQISLGELRGSQAIAQLSDMVIGLERNQQHEREEIRNTTTVRVLKNRYSGLTGPACYLYYDAETGRLKEVPKPDAGNEDDDEDF